MNICYFIPSLHPGGAEFQTVNQVNSLNDRGFNISLIVLTSQLDLLNQITIPKEKIHILEINRITPLRIKSILNLPQALEALHQKISFVQPDVILSILPICHLLCRLNKMLTGQKYALWCYHRSMQFEANPNNTFYKKIFHKWIRYLSKKYDTGHIFISQAVKDNISENMSINNGYVIHNAIPNKSVEAGLASMHMLTNGIPKTQYVVVIPGRLHPTKGHLFFINAIENYLLKTSVEEVKVVIVGGGDLKEKIQLEIDKKGLSHHVYITGFVENQLLLSYLKLADLVCIPSIHEGFGNVAIEALSQGATVLASNTGGLPEIISHGNNGFLFEKENHIDLLQKFQELHENKLLLNPVVLVKSYQERFTLKVQVDKLLSIIN